mgnify:CR=1 FL=1
MNDFLEFEEGKKTIKSLNLDDFSVEDLDDYISELDKEAKRAKDEIKKRLKTKADALKFFK